MLNQKIKQDIMYVLIAFLIVGLVLCIYQLINTLNDSKEYVIARNGRITNYEQDVAYIVREESLIEIGEYSGERQIVIPDNNRAAKGDIIASFALDDNQEIKKSINELDSKIQELISNVSIEYPQDIKSIENNLEINLYSILNDKNDIYNLNNKKKNIDELLEKKIKLVANESKKDSELSKLVDERIRLEKEMNKNKVNIKTDKAGLVSYRVDGYENILSPDSFSNITVDMLKKIKYSTNQLIPVSSNEIKIINNFYAYLIVVSNSEEVKGLNLNDVVKYSIDNNFNDLNRATVEYIINDEDTRYVFLKTTDNIEKLSQYRKLNVNLVWWNYQGTKVPENAVMNEEIKDENNELIAKLNYVNVQGTTGYIKKIWVKVENRAEGYAIIDNYSDDELLELGLPEEKLDGRNKLNLYDKVIIK